MPSVFDSLFATPMAALHAVHAEAVQVQTVADEEPRTIQAVCKIDCEFGNVAYASDGENESLSIGCFRDAVTGIANADVGKDKTRAWYGEDTRPFVFTGMKQNVRPDRWTLLFKRKRPLRQGAVER